MLLEDVSALLGNREDAVGHKNVWINLQILIQVLGVVQTVNALNLIQLFGALVNIMVLMDNGIITGVVQLVCLTLNVSQDRPVMNMGVFGIPIAISVARLMNVVHYLQIRIIYICVLMRLVISLVKFILMLLVVEQEHVLKWMRVMMKDFYGK